MKPKPKKETSDYTIYLFDPETEQILLGSLLIDSEAIYKIASGLHEELFFEPKNKIVCRSILTLFNNSTNIDILTCVNQIKRFGLLEEVGGAYYVSQLTSRIASTINIEIHFKILQQFYLSRLMDSTFTSAKNDLFQNGKDPLEVIDLVGKELEKGLTGVLTREMSSVNEIHRESMSEALVSLNQERSGVISGLNRVDNVTNGWQPTDLIIVAGRPGMGKTALAICLTINPAIYNNEPIGIFSLEMSKKQLVGRMQSIMSGVNVGRIVKKQLSEQEIVHIDSSCKPLVKAPIYIDDTPNLSLNDLKVKSRKLVKEKGVKLIVIDYLQLMRSGLNLRSREEEVSEISKGLKRIAKELNIPVIALSQLSRGLEQRGGDKRPSLSDLRESGQIEQDADMVIFCYRPEYYKIDEYEIGSNSYNTKGLFMFIIAKHRNGELGEIPLTFIHEQTKVANYGETPKTLSFDNNTNVSKLSPNTSFDNSTNVSFLEMENDEEELPF